MDDEMEELFERINNVLANAHQAGVFDSCIIGMRNHDGSVVSINKIGDYEENIDELRDEIFTELDTF